MRDDESLPLVADGSQKADYAGIAPDFVSASVVEADNDAENGHPGVSNMKRNHEHATSNTATMIHLLKSNIGTGIQAMPDAFRNAGLIGGTVGIFGMGLICLHCMTMLVSACHDLCDKLKVPSLDFAEVTYHSFRLGPEMTRRFAVTSRRIVNAFVCLTQFGLCCVYYVFVGKNLETFMRDQLDFTMPIYAYFAALLVPFVLMTFIKSLKCLAPFSMVANVLQTVAIGIIFFFLLRDVKPVEDRPYVAEVQRWPLFLSIAIFTFESVGIVLPLENNMETPRDFLGWTGVLSSGMISVTSLYTAMGFFGYLEYGEDAKGSVTLNLPPGDPLAAAVQLMMILAIFFSYALQFYVPLEILWPSIEERLINKERALMVNYAFRMLLVFLTFAFASLVPNIGLIIALVGALCSSFLALIFPPIIDSVVSWDTIGCFRLCKNIAIVLLGLLGFFVGTYTTLAEIFEEHKAA